MTLEELQDYALKLEGDKKTLEDEKVNLLNEKNDLTALNQNLQRRNNDLFMRVEQQQAGGDNGNDQGDNKENEKVVTCEEFARNYVLGGNK